MNRNKEVVDKAFADYARHIDLIVYNQLDKWCSEIIRKAVFERLNPIGGHNFTGNLINSIVVLLYRKSNSTVSTYFASQTGLKPAIRRELSAITYKGRRRRQKIHFRPGSRFGDRDWSGQWSTLRPENLIPTDESYGSTDAMRFANRWKPKVDADFVVCVAYTSEYATFVEQQRQTTGILETEEFVARTAVEWVGLQKAS